ncbi:MAG: zinc-ribbon domain-containing protein [Promethearchaeota archaeon]
MFCPNCGIELKKSNQRFCSNCGEEILFISGTPQLRAERVNFPSPAIPKSTTDYINYTESVQKPIINEGRPGAYSKKSLAFAIVSIALAILTLFLGSSVLSYIIFMSSFEDYFSINYIALLAINIVIIIINIIGLTLGILSKVYNNKATEIEPENPIKKVGSVFLIFGIILNSISLGAAVIGGIISFFYFY